MENINNGDIGYAEAAARNAATRVCALISDLIGQKVELGIMRTAVTDSEIIEKIVAEPEVKVSCSIIHLKGQYVGTSALITEWDSALRVTEGILNRGKGTTSNLDDEAVSVMTEMANIVCGRFVQGFSNNKALFFLHDVPKHTVCTMQESVRLIKSSLGTDNLPSKNVLVVDFSMKADIFDDFEVKMHFFLLLSSDVIKKIASNPQA